MNREGYINTATFQLVSRHKVYSTSREFMGGLIKSVDHESNRRAENRGKQLRASDMLTFNWGDRSFLHGRGSCEYCHFYKLFL